jgi:hypothetical protein
MPGRAAELVGSDADQVGVGSGSLAASGRSRRRTAHPLTGAGGDFGTGCNIPVSLLACCTTISRAGGRAAGSTRPAVPGWNELAARRGRSRHAPRRDRNVGGIESAKRDLDRLRRAGGEDQLPLPAQRALDAVAGVLQRGAGGAALRRGGMKGWPSAPSPPPSPPWPPAGSAWWRRDRGKCGARAHRRSIVECSRISI